MKTSFTIILISFSVFHLFSQIPSGYYDAAAGLTGEDLKAALHDIIDDHIEFSYGEVRYILDETDADPNNSGQLILLYKGVSNSGTWDGGATWNREHVWAKSHGDFGTDPPAGSDIHHLRPTDPSVNSSRGNKDFDNGGTQHDEATECYYTSETWEPRDAVKGDVARMIFYMEVRYEGDVAGEPDLEMVDYVNSSPNMEPYHGKLSTLLQWHISDPVDDFERNRNEVIYSYQENRNPFIDHPEYVEYIWGDGVPDEPIISQIEYLPENPAPGESIAFSAKVIDDVAVSTVNLKWGTDENNLNQTIAMTDGNEDDIYETTSSIPGQADDTFIYVKIEATDDDDNTTSSSILEIEISNAIHLLNEDFTDCPPVDWTIYSITGSEDWQCESGTISANAYGGDFPSNDWLITPALNLNNYANDKLSFESWTKYSDTSYPTLEVKYSTNYAGSGNPDNATWTDLTVTLSPDNSETWTNSGDIDLSGIASNEVYIGFVYKSSGNAASTCAYWKLDDILVEGEPASDINPPVFSSGYPTTKDSTDTGFDLLFILNEPGTVYYKIVEEGTDAPTINEVVASASINITQANQEFVATISDLSHSTTYEIYCIAEDDEATPNMQNELTKITASTVELDTEPPLFIDNYPEARNIGGTSFDVYAMLNEPGKIYYLLKDNDATAPTIDEIKAAEFFVISEANVEYFANISGLSPETSYDLYLVAEDDEDTPNTMTSAVQLDVTTSEMDLVPPEFIAGFPSAEAITAHSAALHVQLDEKGYLFYKTQLATAAAPSVNTIRSSDTIVVELPNTSYIAEITDLTPETNYVIYAIASDDETNPNFQEDSTAIALTTIGLPPSIVLQPASQNVCEGNGFEFSVIASSSTPMEYQWYKNNEILAGDTLNKLTFSSTNISNTGNYFCAISNTYATTHTDTVLLTVNEEPYAGQDTNFLVCMTVDSINMFDYLPGADQHGIFFDNSQTEAMERNIFYPIDVEPGSYNFTYIVDGGACDDDIAVLNITVDACTGINELKPVMKLFFNTFNELTIRAQDNMIGLTIYNTYGQQVYKQSIRAQRQAKFNTNLRQGLYIIQVETEQGVYCQKILKQF